MDIPKYDRRLLEFKLAQGQSTGKAIVGIYMKLMNMSRIASKGEDSSIYELHNSLIMLKKNHINLNSV